MRVYGAELNCPIPKHPCQPALRLILQLTTDKWTILMIKFATTGPAELSCRPADSWEIRNGCCFQWLRFGMICYAQKLIQALNVSFSIQKDEVKQLFLKAHSSSCFYPIPACMLQISTIPIISLLLYSHLIVIFSPLSIIYKHV